MANEVERTLRTIFKRCVVCPPQGPVCPSCSSGKVCSLVPRVCGQCAYTTCISNPSQSSPPHGPNVGAIVGGVVGGVAFVALMVFLVWRLWIKKRREEQDRELEEKWQTDGAARASRLQGPSDRSSTRTRASLANSILSHASNIIQIAYIPGVMNRRGSGVGDSTPVPPIPAAFRSGQRTPKSPLSNEGDMLFFRPGDLRDSTWSDSSSLKLPGNRDTQYTMQSITPSLARSSVASDTVFYNDATTTPMPAQVFRPSASRMVSIKTSSSTPESEEAPEKKPLTIQIKMPGQESKNATGSIVKASQVQIGGKGKNKVLNVPATIGAAKYAPVTRSPLADADSTTEETQDEDTSIRQSLLRTETPSPTPQTLVSPFDDPSDRSPTTTSFSSSPRPNPYASMASTIRRSTDYGAKRRTRSIGGLSAVIEEATRKTSNSPSTETLKEEAERSAKTGHDSPFGDEHAVD